MPLQYESFVVQFPDMREEKLLTEKIICIYDNQYIYVTSFFFFLLNWWVSRVTMDETTLYYFYCLGLNVDIIEKIALHPPGTHYCLSTRDTCVSRFPAIGQSEEKQKKKAKKKTHSHHSFHKGINAKGIYNSLAIWYSEERIGFMPFTRTLMLCELKEFQSTSNVIKFREKRIHAFHKSVEAVWTQSVSVC